MRATVAEFFNALYRVCLRGNREEQGAPGEDIWASLEAAERGCGDVCVMMEFPTTLEETFAVAASLGVDDDVLRSALTKMPDWRSVLYEWETYRREWWGLE